MRKLLFLTLTTVMMLCANLVQAQTIVGTWATDGKSLMQDQEITPEKAELLFDFKADGTSTITFDIIAHINEEGAEITLGIKATKDFTYEIAENTLKMNKKSGASKLDLYDFDIKLASEIEAQLSAAGMTKAQIKEMMMQQFRNSNMSAMSDPIFEELDSNVFKITSLTNEKLILADKDNVEQTFTHR